MRVLDFFFALRPLVLIPAWSFFLLGYGLTGEGAFPALRFVLTSVVLAAVHLANQVADAESDRINVKGFFLQRGIFSRRTYAAWSVTALVLALAAAVVWRETPLWLGGAAALGLAYSVPPLRWSGRPGLDVLANALGYGVLAVLLGAGRFQEFPQASARLAACALAVAVVFLHTTLLDLEGDRRTGKRTTGVILGASRTRAAAAVLAWGAAAAAAFAAAPVLLGATAALAALAGLAWLRPAWIASSAVGVGGTALFALVAGVYVPLFPAALVVLVLLTRLYYRRRFALAYPSFRPRAEARER